MIPASGTPRLTLPAPHDRSEKKSALRPTPRSVMLLSRETIMARRAVSVPVRSAVRFSRKKHDASFPLHAAAWCFGSAGLKLEDLDSIVFYDKAWVKFERMMESFLSYVPRGLGSFLTAMPIWLKEKLNLRSISA
jgi:predicted NodU family carbamoyl transferase